MCDNLFPSGPWRGYFLDRREPGRHRMDLSLEFTNGRITGEGSDPVGPFIIGGQYDPGSGECRWTKSYIAAHDLFYEGIRVGKSISGIWELGPYRGGFKIWPLASGDTDGDAETEEEEQPVDAVGELVGSGAPDAFSGR